MSNSNHTNKTTLQSGYTKEPPRGGWDENPWLDDVPSNTQAPDKTVKQSQYTKETPKGEWEENPWVTKIVAEGPIEGFGKWTLNEDGLLIIDGKGKMPDWDWRAPWWGHRDQIKTVCISNSVTTIKGLAFEDCSNLTQIQLPNSITRIGACAFEGCSNLTQILLPNSITHIGACAFEGCCSLTKITIPNGLRSISASTFSGCSRLSHITIPNSVTSIMGRAFMDCKSLTQITIPNSVVQIGINEDMTDLFQGCSNLQRVYMPRRFKCFLFDYRYGIPKRIVTFT